VGVHHPLERESVRRALEDAERSAHDLTRAGLRIAVTDEHLGTVRREREAEELRLAPEELGPADAAIARIEQRVVGREGAVDGDPRVGAHEHLVRVERVQGREVGRFVDARVGNGVGGPRRAAVRRGEPLADVVDEGGCVETARVARVDVDRVDAVGGQIRPERGPRRSLVGREREPVRLAATFEVLEQRDDRRRVRLRERVVDDVRRPSAEHGRPIAAIVRSVQRRLHAHEKRAARPEVEQGIAHVPVAQRERAFADVVPGGPSIARRENAVRGCEQKVVRVARVLDEPFGARKAPIGECRRRGEGASDCAQALSRSLAHCHEWAHHAAVTLASGRKT
jgi:hypothetical protein